MRLSIPDLLPDTEYALQVRTVGNDVVSELSPRFIFNTIADTDPPVVPTAFTWVSSGDSFHAEWNAVTSTVDGNVSNVVRYDIELVGNSTTKVISVPQKTDGTKVTYDLSFEQNRALFGTLAATVTARVRAVDYKNFNGAYTSILSASNPVPSNPTAVTATADVNLITLTWTAPSDNDIAGYNIYIGSTKIGFATGTTFVYQTTTYSSTVLKVKTVDKFNQESTGADANAVTPISPFVADTTAPAVPAGLAATITTASTSDLATIATVTWTANGESDLAGYKIRYRKVGDTNWTEETVSKDITTYVVTNLKPYTNYEFQVRAFDWSGNFSAWSSTVTSTGATNGAPSTPTAPSVSSNTLQIQVTVPGTKAAGGAMESDVVFYEVYASTTTAFTPASANMIGVIPVGPALTGVFSIPASGGSSTQTWFVKIIAVDNGGLKSSASAQTTSSPNLIAATNIVDATITNAKISDLAADKITAGSGIINALTVKNTLTLGDASTNGVIQSFDYSAGTAGFKLQKNALEINAGTIRAAALVLQQGENIIVPGYGDFESVASFYTTGIVLSAGSAAINTTDKKFNNQSLKWTTATSSTLTLAPSVTAYGTNVDPSTSYIISYYAMVKSADAAVSIQPTLKYSTATTPGNLNGTNQAIPNNSTWARYSTTVTTPGTATGGALLFFTASAASNVYLDGIQIETQWTSATTPSPWTPPSTTRIDGGMIRTGSIQSTNTALVWDDPSKSYITDPQGQPAWIINTAGAAVFSDLAVTGRVVVGAGTESIDNPSTVASYNYIPGGAGWIMRSDGQAEFQNLTSSRITGSDIVGSSFETSDPDNPDSAVISINPQDGFMVTGPPSLGSPTYINFPTNGAPNIISGQLTATTLSVVSGSSFSGPATLEVGASLTITGSFGSPKNAPVLGNEYTTPFAYGIDVDIDKYNLGGMTLGHDNHYYSVSYIPDTAGGINKIFKFNSGTGAITKFNVPWLTAANNHFYQTGIVYSSVTGYYYVAGWDYTTFNTVRIVTLDNTFARVNEFSSSLPLIQGGGGPMVGWDYTNNRLMVTFWSTTAGDLASRTFNMTSGVPVSTNSTVTLPMTGVASASTIKYNLFQAHRGSFDIGGDRYVVKMSSNAAYKNFYIFNASTQARVTTEEWPAAPGWEASTWWFWDGFYFRHAHNIAQRAVIKYSLMKYEGGDNYWVGSTTSGSALWNVGYTWYDSNATGGTHETGIGPVGTITRIRRSRLRFTIDQIPTLTGSDTPNAARIYRYRGTFVPGSGGFLSQTTTLTSGVMSDTVGSPYVIPTALTTPAIFPGSSAPGQIVSSTGNSFWRGDDIAQFYSLVLTGSEDADLTAGNTPALRIGDTGGSHMRVDANELIAMSGDTTQTILNLNIGDKVQFGAKTFQGGSVDVTSSGSATNSVNVNYSPSFRGTPFVMITPRNSTAFNQTSNYWVTSADSNGFTLNVARTNSGTVSYWWFAVDL